MKKCIWFMSISRNSFVVLLSSAVAFVFEDAGYSPFVLSGT